MSTKINYVIRNPLHLKLSYMLLNPSLNEKPLYKTTQCFDKGSVYHRLMLCLQDGPSHVI